MLRRLPEFIEPLRLAKKRHHLSGSISVSRMPRVIEALLEPKGEVVVDLQFSQTASGQYIVKGDIRTCLPLLCQRCVQAMGYEVDIPVSLGFVNSAQQAERLTEEFEAYLLPESELKLSELVEDELILALPVAPLHEVENCPAGDKFRSTSSDNRDENLPANVIGQDEDANADVKEQVKDESHIDLLNTGLSGTNSPNNSPNKENPFAILQKLKSKQD